MSDIKNKGSDKSSGDGDRFNKEEVYREKLAPLVKKLSQACAINNIPFLFVTATSDTGNKTSYHYAGNFPGSIGLRLSENRFPKHFAVMHGFGVYHPSTHRVLTEEDISPALSDDGGFDAAPGIMDDISAGLMSARPDVRTVTAGNTDTGDGAGTDPNESVVETAPEKKDEYPELAKSRAIPVDNGFDDVPDGARITYIDKNGRLLSGGTSDNDEDETGKAPSEAEGAHNTEKSATTAAEDVDRVAKNLNEALSGIKAAQGKEAKKSSELPSERKPKPPVTMPKRDRYGRFVKASESGKLENDSNKAVNRFVPRRDKYGHFVKADKVDTSAKKQEEKAGGNGKQGNMPDKQKESAAVTVAGKTDTGAVVANAGTAAELSAKDVKPAEDGPEISVTESKATSDTPQNAPESSESVSFEPAEGEDGLIDFGSLLSASRNKFEARYANEKATKKEEKEGKKVKKKKK